MSAESGSLMTSRAPPGAAQPLRLMAEQAFSRAAGAPLLQENRIQLLKNAQENYPAWLEAIGSARKTVPL